MVAGLVSLVASGENSASLLYVVNDDVRCITCEATATDIEELDAINLNIAYPDHVVSLFTQFSNKIY